MTEPTRGDLILYESSAGKVRVEVHYQDKTVGLSQWQMANLFGVDVRTINEHLRNIDQSGELAEEATVRRLRVVRTEGKRSVAREIAHYDLDVTISVGYRVNSTQATRFRIWATNTLREIIVKGFVLDDERLKLNTRIVRNYFEELLERIREICASERRFYLKIAEIYEQCSIDYESRAESTHTFFRTVQNNLHRAVTDKSAVEIIAARPMPRSPRWGSPRERTHPTARSSRATSP